MRRSTRAEVDEPPEVEQPVRKMTSSIRRGAATSLLIQDEVLKGLRHAGVDGKR